MHVALLPCYCCYSIAAAATAFVAAATALPLPLQPCCCCYSPYCCCYSPATAGTALLLQLQPLLLVLQPYRCCYSPATAATALLMQLQPCCCSYSPCCCCYSPSAAATALAAFSTALAAAATTLPLPLQPLLLLLQPSRCHYSPAAAATALAAAAKTLAAAATALAVTATAPSTARVRLALPRVSPPCCSRAALSCPPRCPASAVPPCPARELPCRPPHRPALPACRPALHASLALARRPARRAVLACVLPCCSRATLLCPLWLLSAFSHSILRAWTRRSPLSRAVSLEPRRSRYRADGPFHLVLRSRVPPPPVLPQPPGLFSSSSQRGHLHLAYVASHANTADIFTKAHHPCDHQRFCTVLGLVPTWPHLLTVYGDFVIHPELALIFMTGLVTSCYPPLCLWGVYYLYSCMLLVHTFSFMLLTLTLPEMVGT
ncbi:unnamed protein product [Closterium sp. NIES-54]